MLIADVPRVSPEGTKLIRWRSSDMDYDQEKLAIARKLARCRQLAKEFREGISAQNLRSLEAQLVAELRQIEELQEVKRPPEPPIFLRRH